jgi:hypothetical protein
MSVERLAEMMSGAIASFASPLSVVMVTLGQGILHNWAGDSELVHK